MLGMKILRKMKSFLLLLLGLLLLAGCGLIDNELQTEQRLTQVSTSFEAVAKYIEAHHELPDNFITKAEARKLGWESDKGNLNEVAPDKSIGGDVFQNREGKLPKHKGRVWYEADINYKSGFRGGDRILYSNDGLIYKTEDHYETFQQIK